MSKKINSISLSNSKLEQLEGELLGDGCLCLAGKQSLNPLYTQNSKHMKYLQFLSQEFSFLHGRCIKPDFKNIKNKIYPQFKIYSLSYNTFLPIYRRWYGFIKNKQVPEDFIFTPYVLKHWILGDGSIQLRSKGAHNNSLRLYTNSFNRKSLDILKKQFLKIFNYSLKESRATRQTETGEGLLLYISDLDNITTVLNYAKVGIIPDCYKYKFP